VRTSFVLTDFLAAAVMRKGVKVLARVLVSVMQGKTVLFSFALRVLRWCGFGFAAGCEAVAVPRRRGAFYIFGLCPWCGLGLINPKG
jgi:hypothetical protein